CNLVIMIRRTRGSSLLPSATLSNAMTIGGNAGTLNAVANGALTLSGGTYATLNGTSGAGITQSGALTVSGTTTATANSGTIGTASLKDTNGGIILGGGTATALNVTSTGNITQSGALTVSGATTLTADTNAITATLTTGGNDFNTVSLASTNSGTFSTASVTDTNAMTIGGNAGTLNAVANGALTL